MFHSDEKRMKQHRSQKLKEALSSNSPHLLPEFHLMNVIVKEYKKNITNREQ